MACLFFQKGFFTLLPPSIFLDLPLMQNPGDEICIPSGFFRYLKTATALKILSSNLLKAKRSNVPKRKIAMNDNVIMAK